MKLKKLNIPFNYKSTIDIELNELNYKKFRWIICEEEGVITGFHRSIIIEGWGFLAGVFISEKNSDPWLLNKLVKYAISDLSHRGCIGVIAWDTHPLSNKTPILIRLGFSQYPFLVYRFIFDINGINSLRIIPKANQIKWRLGNSEDYRNIKSLLNTKSSFIDSLPIKPEGEGDNWVVLQEKNAIIAAINWSVHGNVLEIFFTLSSLIGLDIMDGLQFLVSEVIKNNDIELLKINLEQNRKITLMRLMSCHPKTYQKGYENTCLVRKV
ncbi:hypothetical protein [Psychrobacillus sp. FSL H8-0510]|uniref:hypothetical protein n=1 Tax=Psychrobacillus sp. FSL H8-0510 TaxID=2921394 RepID=UPI0030FB4901